MFRCQVRNQYESHAQVLWKSVKQLFKCLQPACRGPHAYNRKLAGFALGSSN